MELTLLKFDVTGLPIMNVNMRAIPTYKKVMERVLKVEGDADGRKKKQNIKEMAFIHLYTHFQLDEKTPNPYWKKSPDERLEKLKLDLGMATDWKIDEELQAAIDLYKERVVINFDTLMLDAAEHAARQTIDFLMNVDYTLRDSRGNFIYKPIEVMKTIKEVGTTLDELQKIRERAQNGQKAATGKVRGGGEVGSREDPKR